MFFREKTSKTSKNPTLQLVENFRDQTKIRQRVVVSLGVDFDIPKPLRNEVAACVEQKLLGQPGLFDNSEVIQIADRVVKKIQTAGHWTASAKLPTPAKSATAIPVTPPTPDAALAPTPRIEAAPEVAEVYVDGVEHGHDRVLGPLLIGHSFWLRLEFPKLLAGCGFNNQQIHTAEISILNRLIAQNTEHTIPAWIKTVAVEDLIDKAAEDFADDRFYQISDLLLRHQATIQTQLYEKEKSLFNLNNTIYLYDLTNTYFEGMCARNPQAQFNKNQKEKRTDCRQIVIALVLDEEGFIRRYHQFSGKMTDVKSLEKILQILSADFQDASLPTIVMDRGLASDENMTLLKSKGLHYIIATRSGEEKQFLPDFVTADFTVVKNEPENTVKVSLKQDDQHTYLLCHSESRHAKEEAMRNQAEQRLDHDLAKLKQLIEKGQRIDPLIVERSIGRLKERHARVAQYYEIEYTPYTFDFQLPAGTVVAPRLENSLNKLKIKAAQFTLSHHKLKTELETLSQKYPDDYSKINIQIQDPVFSGTPMDEKRNRLQQLDGNYLLKTNRMDLNAPQIWQIYMMLTRVEAAFRDLKTVLKLRPNFHQIEKRVAGHVWITILTYHLLHSIDYTLRQNDCTLSWETVKRLVSTHMYATITLPTTRGTVIHVRKPGLLEPVHAEIYRKLQIDVKELPTRKIEIYKK
jgi:transposase